MGTYIPKVGRQPHLFLSHSSKDKFQVTKLAKDLASCEIDVWLYKWEIEIGESIFAAVNKGLASSKYIALLFSKAFMESKWGTAEVDAAFNKQVNQNKKIIIPLILERVELPALVQGLLNLPLYDDKYYSSLAKLAGLIHGIDLQILSEAIEVNKLESLEDVLKVIFFCGVDPYMIIPKDVFDELSKIDGVEVNNNRLRFNKILFPLEALDVTSKTKIYIERIWRGIDRDPERKLYFY